MSMEKIETYYKKVDRMLSARSRSVKNKGKGLLSPSMSAKAGKEERDDSQMKVIADIVEGIRQARKEMMNGR